VRRVLGPVLLALGGFLLASAVLAIVYAADAVRVTPLDVKSVNILTGTAVIGADAAAPVRATSTTLADSARSDGGVVAFRNSTCLVKVIGDTPNCVSADDPGKRLVAASEDSFATDRKTALAVNDAEYVPAGATEHEGLVNKFPFDTEKKTYPYWDGLLGETVDATYDGEAKVQGIDTYRFEVRVEDAPIEITDGVDGTYSTAKTIYVEPVTGSILNQTEQQRRVTDSGNNVLDLSLEMAADSSRDLADDARSNKLLLTVVGTWIPLGGGIAGLVLLFAGGMLVAAERRKG